MCVCVCVCVCVCACDDFLKSNIYDSFMYKNFIRKILIATVYFFHQSLLKFHLAPFLNITFFYRKYIYDGFFER